MKRKDPKLPPHDPLEVKGRNLNPVILEIPEEESSRNKSLIKKMMQANNSSLHYSGGFKNIDNSKIDSCISKSLYRPEQRELSEEEIMGQIGVSKTRVQPKYRDENVTVGERSKNYESSDLESKLQILRRERADKNYSLLRPSDQYTIADNPSRFQQAIHVKSSLDTINLENIEAKLEAHRRSMKPIEERYNEERGRVPPSRLGMKVNIDVDKQFGELKMERNKIYEISKVRQEMEPDQVDFEELWELKKQSDPKLAEYDAKYQQYLLEKDAKNLIGCTVRNNLFTWDKYKQLGSGRPKSKVKLHAEHHRSKSPKKGMEASALKEQFGASKEQYGADGLVSVKDLKDVIATKDDKFISSYIFTQLDSDKVGFISKEEFHEYILSQQHIINGYHIDTKWLFTDLDNFETKRKGMLNRAELAVFLATLDKVNHPALTLTDKSSLGNAPSSIAANSKPVASTFEKNKHIFYKLFKVLDLSDDGLIKREEYIENIYLDADCAKLMDKEAILIRPISKSIKYRQIIGFILDDYTKEKNPKLKKSKEYLTFARFAEYFEAPESLDLTRIDRDSQKKKRQESSECTIFDMPQEYLFMLKDIYNALPRIYQDYIVSQDFVQNALRDPQILAVSDELSRIQSVQTNLPLQCVQGTLHRMQKECDEYSNWDTLKLYFSRRGRPLDWDFELIEKKKELRNQRLKQNRSSLSREKLRETAEYFNLADRMKNRSKQKLLKGPDRYTVPEPFDITDMREKPNNREVSRGKQEFDQYHKEFKAKPVNLQILEPKPDLIMGKTLSKAKDKKPEYNYENYENDRIERALKKAEEQYQLQQQIKKIKEKTAIKALDIGVDLTKKYQDVIKEQKKQQKKKQQKNKTTQPEVSDSLYPKNITDEKAKKLKKAEENMKKMDEIAKRKKELQKESVEEKKRKNEEAKRKAEEAKRVERELEEERKKMETDGFDFKPKIKTRELSEQEKKDIEEGRKNREKKKLESEELMLAQEELKKKRLAYEKKSQFLDIEGMEDSEILQKLDQINFEDLLLDEKDKQDYRKQFDNKNKTRKELKDREAGLAGRERAAMEEEDRRLQEEKKRYKEKVQKQKTNKGSFSRVSEKGESVVRGDLDFHRSKALRRYRALMEGNKPPSQWDKYSVFSEDK